MLEKVKEHASPKCEKEKENVKRKEEKEEKNRKLQTSVVLERLYGNSSKLSRFQQISML